MTVDLAAEIAAAVAAREPVNGIRIVGVDGPAGSGKTFLAARLSAALAAPVVEIDDFVSWDCFAGWWPRFDAEVLTPLLAGRDATYQARDWSDWYGSSLVDGRPSRGRRRSSWRASPARRREAVGRIAYAVWVEAPAPHAPGPRHGPRR